MSDLLPDRADLGQLRRRAKELRDAGRRGDVLALERFARHHPSAQQRAAVSLAAAQLVIARELGFPSWPRLRAAIDTRATAGQAAGEFAAACVDGRLHRASEIFRAEPGIVDRSLLAAAVLGDADAVRQALAADPPAAVAIDDQRGWPPLLYACYSRWHQIDPTRATGLAEVVRILLAAGASPDTNDGGRPRYRSALKGSVEVNNPGITAVLLDAGANPDAGQPVGEAVGHRDHRCLRLLLAHGASVAGTWAVGAAVYHDDPVAVSLLLGALRAGGRDPAREATGALPDAAAHACLPVVAALLDAGADPRATEDDVSALRLAVRAGRADTANQLRAAGAADDSTDVDHFIGACLAADRPAAERLLASHRDLSGRLTGQDLAVIVDAAGSYPAAAITLMLDLGFSPHARNNSGEQPLHTAAYCGNTPVVRALLEAGADVDARDTSFDATPLAFATVGSGEQAGQPGDWAGTVRLLIDAGASRQDVWITGKPPGEQITSLLERYGITPEMPAETEAGDEDVAPGPIDAGVMGDIARHLHAAHLDSDLELLASLLHPLVHWTGLCGDREQVLDWYRGLIAAGTVATVTSVEVDRDAVVLGLAVAGTAEGARPAEPQQIYQVFTVGGAQITGIRGYPDRHSALTRDCEGHGQ